MPEGAHDTLLRSAHVDLPGSTQNWAMGAICLSIFLSIFDYTATNMALPVMARDLHVGDESSLWILNAYQFSSLVTLFPLVAIGRKIGYKALCMTGLVLLGVASIWCAQAQSLVFLTLGRVVQGLGGACIMGANLALIRIVSSPENLGRRIGMNSTVIGLAVAMGPSLGALIVAWSDWHMLFWINVPLSSLALFYTWTKLPRTEGAYGPVAIPRLIVLIGSLSLVVGGLDMAIHDVQRLWATAALFAGVLSGVLLFRDQLSSSHPVFPADLYRHPLMARLSLVTIAAFIASNLFLISIAFTLQGVLHRTALVSGIAITAWPMGVITTSAASGRNADRFPGAVLVTIGLLLMGSSFLGLWLVLPVDNLGVIMLCIFLAGMGSGIFQPPNNRMIMLMSRPGREGGASAIASFSRLSGQTLGAMAVAWIFRLIPIQGGKLCLVSAAVISLLAAAASFPTKARVTRRQSSDYFRS